MSKFQEDEIYEIFKRMYLYIDNKMVYVNQIEKQEQRIEKLEKQVMELQEKLLKVVLED